MTHSTVLKRIRAEYVEMPDMQLTLEQAQRLFGVERTLCETVFDALVDEQFLWVKPRGLYARVPDGGVPRHRGVPRPRPATANL